MDLNELIKKCRHICGMPLRTQRDVVRALEAAQSRDVRLSLLELSRPCYEESWGHWLYIMSVWGMLHAYQMYLGLLWEAVQTHYPEWLRARATMTQQDFVRYFYEGQRILDLLQRVHEPRQKRLLEASLLPRAQNKYLPALEVFVEFCEGNPDTLEDPWPEIARMFRTRVKTEGLEVVSLVVKLLQRIPNPPDGAYSVDGVQS